jgi:hypothetical protein
MIELWRELSRITVAQAQPYVIGWMLVLAALTLGIAASLLRVYGVGHWRLAWRLAFKHHGSLHLILSLAAAIIAVLIIQSAAQRDPSVSAFRPRVMEAILPLAGAVMAAFAFAPDDEAPLEILLAAPRPPYLILLERLMALMLPLIVLGVGFTALVGGDVRPLMLVTWIAPTLFLMGVSARLTLQARRSTAAILVALLVWGAMVIGGHLLIQAFPSLSHLYFFLDPAHAAESTYTLNRLLLLIGGLALIAHAALLCTREEHLLKR